MDLLSIIGLLLGIGAIIGGNYLEGGTIDALVNIPALLIVGGGTIGATLLQTEIATFINSLKMLRYIFIPPQFNLNDMAQNLIQISTTARKEGILILEKIANEQEDDFLAKGLQLVADGTNADNLRQILEQDLLNLEEYQLKAAKVFENMGGYSPTIGIIGAVMGLIHLMSSLAEPSKLGTGIATAFVATVYGVAFANLLLLPIGNKLKSLVLNGSKQKEMQIIALVSMVNQENPQGLELKLQGFI